MYFIFTQQGDKAIEEKMQMVHLFQTVSAAIPVHWSDGKQKNAV